MSAQPITLIEAVTQALAYEMKHDPSVVVLGEDVGVNGGVFRATAGLHAEFGSERVIDTPLDETTIAGLTVGWMSPTNQRDCGNCTSSASRPKPIFRRPTFGQSSNGPGVLSRK